MASNSLIVQLNNIKFSWQNNDKPTLIISEFSIKRQEHLFIKGPSGCGKSTLLSLLTGINIPQSGQVKILSTILSDLSTTKRDIFRADNIGYIFQQFNLLPYLSVLDNILLPTYFSKNNQASVEQAKKLTQRLQLPLSIIYKQVMQLSVGQQQRVAAARALIMSPPILIADEPTSALDSCMRRNFIKLLMEEASNAKSTLVFVSHDQTLEPLFKRSINLPDLNQAKQEKLQ